MFRKIVSNQALRFVPSRNRVHLLHARRSVSCKRSSEADADPERETANACKCLISDAEVVPKSSDGSVLPSRNIPKLARMTRPRLTLAACSRGSLPARASLIGDNCEGRIGNYSEREPCRAPCCQLVGHRRARAPGRARAIDRPTPKRRSPSGSCWRSGVLS